MSKPRPVLDGVTPLRVDVANDAWRIWSQDQVRQHHYLHAPVDDRSKPLVYTIVIGGVRAGCLIFGRPEATRCYHGDLRFGSVADVASGKAQYTRWEVVNLARVWIDAKYQHSGIYYVRNAATVAIALALRAVVVDYLAANPPCFLDEPWRLRWCISYCDTKQHRGTLYKAAGFRLVHTNTNGLQTWARPLRGLQGHERKQIEHRAEQSLRSRHHRSMRAAAQVEQLALEYEK